MHFLSSFLVGVLCLSLFAGCTTSALDVKKEKKPLGSVQAVRSAKEIQAQANILEEAQAIPVTSPLSSLAEALDKVAIGRSVPLQELRAAQAERAAAQFQRYPKITPSASAPLNGGGASFGINLEQNLWDGGRTRSRLTEAELDILEARADTWQDRNQVIYDGLSAFVKILRYNDRIQANENLKRDLSKLNGILGDRITGGVADRGEQLRMLLSLQEAQRDILFDQSELRSSKSTLARLIAEQNWPKSRSAILLQSGVCSRKWPTHEAPSVMQARVLLMRAENERNIVMARRLPRVFVGAGLTYSPDGFSKPTVSLRLDASDMLGLGRKQSIEAAEAARTGALRAYDLQKSDTDAELEKLEQGYFGDQSDISQLSALQKTNTENLTLYREQVEAGTIPIAEGITLFRESANTVIDLIDARARALENCLETARLRGALAPFGIIHE